MKILINSISKTVIHTLKSYRITGRAVFCESVLYPNFSCNHSYATQNNYFKKTYLIVPKHYFSDDKGSIIPKSAKENAEVSTSIRETVKENTKTTFYSLVIVAGIGVTALLFYVVFRELFSSKSPNSVYTKAFERCAQDTRIQDALGDPIKGHGETTRRGRRRHVSHVTYMKDNVEHLRMQFYLKGSRKSATVQLEVIEGASGSYEYRYLFVQMDEWPHKIIVLEDNRYDRSMLRVDVKTPLDIDTESLNLS